MENAQLKTWYLSCGNAHAYAVVIAKTKEEAFEKLLAKRKVEARNIEDWEFEEFDENAYDGILYFY